MSVVPSQAVALYQENIIAAIHAGLSQPRKQPGLFNALLEAVGGCAQAYGSTMESATMLSLDGIFSDGLSSHLVKALRQIVDHVPGLQHAVRVRLLDLVAAIMSSQTFQEFAMPVTSSRRASLATMPEAPRTPTLHRRRSSSLLGRARGRSLSPKRIGRVSSIPEDRVELQILALDTLATFDFGVQPSLLSYYQQHILDYCTVEDPLVRKAAIQACSTYLAASGMLGTKHNLVAVQDIVQAVLHAGVADLDPSVREIAINTLGSPFDQYLVG